MFKKKFMDFGFFPDDLRQRASTSDLGFGGFPPTSSRFSGDPFVNQQSQRNLGNLKTTSFTDDYDLGLCQNLSKMGISDSYSEFHCFSGSRNLHGCSRLDQNLSGYDSFLNFSSRREGSLQSSHGGGFVVDGDCHRLRLLGSQDFPNPNSRDMSRHNRDYLSEHLSQQIRRDFSSLIPQKSRVDFHENASLMYNGNTNFPPFSAIGDCSREVGASIKCMKNKSSCNEINKLLQEHDLPLNLASMVKIFGSVYLMAKDQMGCRFLQELIERGSFLDGMIIYREVINHVIELGVDQFGNYFIQKLIQVCNEEQRTKILVMFTSKPGLLVKISLNSYGTRCVQKLIETLSTKEQINLVKSALKPGFLSLVRDSNGNHVIQSCLKFFGPNDNKFVFEAVTMLCAEIATHRHGCCVIKRCLLNSDEAQRERLLAEISRNSLLLAQDPFGNYVVQYIIEQKLEGVNVMFELRGNYVKLATQKFSSHVVEKCLRHYPESRAQIVRELVSVPNFETLLQDPYANYVIKSALSLIKGFVRASLVEKVRRYGNLRTSPYCKKIFSNRFLKM